MSAGNTSMAALLRQMVSGHMQARAMQVAARAGIFDALDGRARSSEDLANDLGLHAGATHRLLRVLAAAGLARHEPPDRFGASRLGRLLHRDEPGSLRNLAMLLGSERSWRSWERLDVALRTGRSQARELYGMNGFDYFQLHPHEGAIFHAAMAEVSVRVAQALVRAFDFSPYASIVDVGGGNGELMTALLRAAPAARGILFDLPQALEGAGARMADAGLLDRCEVRGGDFFLSVPRDQSLYVLKNVLHDWDDADCVRILEKVREAMTPSSHLAVVERVLPSRVTKSIADRQATWMDLNMMVTSGGTERTRGEFKSLLEQAGLQLSGMKHLDGGNRFACLRATPRR